MLLKFPRINQGALNEKNIFRVAYTFYSAPPALASLLSMEIYKDDKGGVAFTSSLTKSYIENVDKNAKINLSSSIKEVMFDAFPVSLKTLIHPNGLTILSPTLEGSVTLKGLRVNAQGSIEGC